jgi:hypothetical protein
MQTLVQGRLENTDGSDFSQVSTATANARKVAALQHIHGKPMTVAAS